MATASAQRLSAERAQPQQLTGPAHYVIIRETTEALNAIALPRPEVGQLQPQLEHQPRALPAAVRQRRLSPASA